MIHLSLLLTFFPLLTETQTYKLLFWSFVIARASNDGTIVPCLAPFEFNPPFAYCEGVDHDNPHLSLGKRM